MSDVLVVLPSEAWYSLKRLVAESGGSLGNHAIWGDGSGPSLQKFLDKALSEMAYDENCHIITRVKRVELETRCPYKCHAAHKGKKTR